MQNRSFESPDQVPDALRRRAETINGAVFNLSRMLDRTGIRVDEANQLEAQLAADAQMAAEAEVRLQNARKASNVVHMQSLIERQEDREHIDEDGYIDHTYKISGLKEYIDAIHDQNPDQGAASLKEVA